MEKNNLNNELSSKFDELKALTLIGVKQALTTSDASLFTGLSKSHLYKLVCSKKIPYYKSQGGKLTFFDKDELTKWMLQHRVKTVDELETDAITYAVTGKHSKKGGEL